MGEDDDTAEGGNAGSLGDVINDLTDRKRSSILSREEGLMSYVRILTSQYIEEGLEGHLHELLSTFAKSIRSESSERETVLALKAVGLTAVTTLDDSVYDSMVGLVRRTVSDSASMPTKTAAMHCLGTCTFFGGAGDEEILDQMTFLMEIVSSDGHYIDAHDDPDVVTAALEEWGFLATEIEDLEHESEDAVEVFAEQLESSASAVQVAAGENIALLYEKSYSPQEDDEDDPAQGEEDSRGSIDGRSSPMSDDEDGSGEKLIKRYNAYHNTPHVIHQIESLAHISGRHIKKRDKRTLHSNFASVLTTVENPRRGPHYNRAIDSETQREYGSRKTVKFQQDSFMRVDRWWKWLRLAALRRLLRGGFVSHYFEGNRAVLDCLPVMMSFDQPQSPRSKAREKQKSGKKSGGRKKAVEGL